MKVSDEDLAWLSPDQPAEDRRRALARGGPAIIVVTRGGDGSMAFARSGRIDVATAPTTVVDTVGAGDSYMSGLIAGLEREDLLAVERRDDLGTIAPETLARVTSAASASAAWTASLTQVQNLLHPKRFGPRLRTCQTRSTPAAVI